VDKIELLNRTRQFAIRVFKLLERLPKTEAAKIVTYQLLKSSSSVAANYRAVNRAKSKNDFSNKIKIVLEEADESNFWLTFISDVDLLSPDDKELNSLTKESDEFVAIFTASLKTLNKQNQKS
jgi:four helix bundle protein